MEGIDEAIARVEAAREAGANASFVEAPASLEDMAEIGSRSTSPNVANMVAGGKTPIPSRVQLAQMGFHLILHPLCGLTAAAKTLQSVFGKLAREGTLTGSDDDFMSFTEFNDLIGVDERISLAERFGVKS